MRRFTVLFLAALFTTLFSFSVQAADQKLGFVDMNKAINQSEAGKKSRLVLEAKYKQNKQMLGMKEQEIRREIESLQSSMMLSADAKKQKQEKLQKMDRDYRMEKKRVERAFYQDQKKHTDKLLSELTQVSRDIGKREGYDMVMELSMLKMMLYSKNKVTDITDKVIQEYNKITAEK